MRSALCLVVFVLSAANLQSAEVKPTEVVLPAADGAISAEFAQDLIVRFDAKAESGLIKEHGTPTFRWVTLHQEVAKVKIDLLVAPGARSVKVPPWVVAKTAAAGQAVAVKRQTWLLVYWWSCGSERPIISKTTLTIGAAEIKGAAVLPFPRLPANAKVPAGPCALLKQAEGVDWVQVKVFSEIENPIGDPIVEQTGQFDIEMAAPCAAISRAAAGRLTVHDAHGGTVGDIKVLGR